MNVVYLNYFRAVNRLQFGQAVTDPLRVHPPFQQVQHITCTEQAVQYVISGSLLILLLFNVLKSHSITHKPCRNHILCNVFIQ